MSFKYKRVSPQQLSHDNSLYINIFFCCLANLDLFEYLATLATASATNRRPTILMKFLKAANLANSTTELKATVKYQETCARTVLKNSIYPMLSRVPSRKSNSFCFLHSENGYVVLIWQKGTARVAHQEFEKCDCN